MSDLNFKFNRLISALIDGLIMFIILVIVCIAPSIVVIRDMMNDSYFISDVIWLISSIIGSFLLWILYLTLTPIFLKNATVGMKVSKLVFVKSNNDHISFLNLFVRQLVSIVCFLFSFGFALIFDLISVFSSPKGQNFYDIFSNVKVVDKADVY